VDFNELIDLVLEETNKLQDFSNDESSETPINLTIQPKGHSRSKSIEELIGLIFSFRVSKFKFQNFPSFKRSHWLDQNREDEPSFETQEIIEEPKHQIFEYENNIPQPEVDDKDDTVSDNMTNWITKNRKVLH
jgi:hypothetical protein